MTGFTLTIEDLKSAPIEVRRWLVARLERDLLGLISAAPTSPPVPASALAPCTPEEAVAIFDLLKGDFAATHVFLELARDEPGSEAAIPLHAVSIGALIRNTRLDEHRLASCLQTINRAFQAVCKDPEAALIGFDQANHVYVHETTCHSIRSLWQELVRVHAPVGARAGEPVDWPLSGFQPRQLGPSENIATHQQY